MFVERNRAPAQQSQAWLQRQAGKVEAAVEEIARRIDPGTPFALGESFGLGDIAVGCLLGYLDLRYPALDWRRHDHLRALFDRLSQRTSLRETVPVAQTITSKVA